MYAQMHISVCLCRARDSRQSCGRCPAEPVCEAREGQQTNVHTLAAQDAMIRPVAFTRSYWLRRRHALLNRLLRLYLQTGMPQISQSGISLRLLSLTQTHARPMYFSKTFGLCRGSKDHERCGGICEMQ